MSPNCSFNGAIPKSEEFLNALTDVDLALVILCVVLCVTAMAILVDNFIFICRKHSKLKRAVITSTWLVGLCPILSLIALMAMLVPHAFLFRDVIVSVFLSVVMYKFVQLLSTYARHFDGVREHIMTTKKIQFNVRPVCCCCPCLPTANPTRNNIQILKALVLQFPVIMIFLTVIIMVTWLDGKYHPGSWKGTNSYPYLSVTRIVSVVIALYALNVLVTLCKDAMKTFYVKQKFMALTLCLTFYSIQGLIFDIMANNGVFDTSECFSGAVMGSFYENMAYCIEMFLLTVLNLWSYRRPLGPPINMVSLEKSNTNNGAVDNTAYDTVTEFQTKGGDTSATTATTLKEISPPYSTTVNTKERQISDDDLKVRHIWTSDTSGKQPVHQVCPKCGHVLHESLTDVTSSESERRDKSRDSGLVHFKTDSLSDKSASRSTVVMADSNTSHLVTLGCVYNGLDEVDNHADEVNVRL